MGLDRRDFLKLLGVSATAPMLSCASGPVEKIIPYVIQPEDIVPGVAVYYATVCQECPASCGMLVRTREGRAVKVEGNPSHPVNSGSLCARGQASLQGLYNPDRIRQPLSRDASGALQPVSWQEAEQILVEKLQTLRTEDQANTIAFLTGQLADSLHRLIEEWLRVFGSQHFVTFEPFAYESLRQASQICFAQASLPSYAIDQAEFLISFGADFLETWRSPLEYAKAFGKMRQRHAGEQPGTFIQVEPRLSQTGANADTWVSIQPGTEAFLALGMARIILAEKRVRALEEKRTSAQSIHEVEKLTALLAPYSLDRVATLTGVPSWRIQGLARDFSDQRPSLALGAGVATSSHQGTAGQVAVLLLNYVAGNIGKTVLFEASDSVSQSFSQVAPYTSLQSLISTMEDGNVPLLLLAHTNPAFTAPQASGFTTALSKVPCIVSFSSFLDETTEHAHLILPDHTPLESWGDTSPRPGVHGLMQPVMTPVFNTKAMGDVLISVATRVYERTEQTGQDAQTKQDGQVEQVEQKDEQREPIPSWNSFFECLQDTWKTIHQEYVHAHGAEIDFDTFWRDALQHGGYWDKTKPTAVQLSPAVYEQTFAEPVLSGPEHLSIPLLLYPSSRYFDGRGANKPWLQELPDPITNAVWDSWVEIHPGTASRLGITDGDVLILTSQHGMLEAPAYVYAHMQPDMLAMPIGQGHTAYGRYAEGRGANPIQLLPAEPEKASGGLPWFSTRVQIAGAGRREPLVTTAGSHRQIGRGMAQSVTAAALAEQHTAAHASEAAHSAHAARDMYPALEYEKYRWGMSIDLSSCIGCGACVTACYAENNIPVVGKDMVAQGREMAWLRIERYFADDSPQYWDPDTPDVSFSPMLCQHCGNAPCEPVCPVYATYHNPEGLNAQVYNRCVGTRYCSNNCPYKVRRFNWSQAEWPEPLQRQLNPDVTVREAGVMEKCTFCVQRIQAGKDRAKDDNRSVRDGEITPACAQTCPTQAITFGNLEDPDSAVSHQSHNPRAYKVLEELNTKPAITYLKRVVNRGQKS